MALTFYTHETMGVGQVWEVSREWIEATGFGTHTEYDVPGKIEELVLVLDSDESTCMIAGVTRGVLGITRRVRNTTTGASLRGGNFNTVEEVQEIFGNVAMYLAEAMADEPYYGSEN